MSRKGFTLIELLICIVIVGILATVAMLGYQHYAGSARVTEVITSIGAIVRAQRIYMQAHGRYFNAENQEQFKQHGLELSFRFFTYRTWAQGNDGFEIEAMSTDIFEISGESVHYVKEEGAPGGWTVGVGNMCILEDMLPQ